MTPLWQRLHPVLRLPVGYEVYDFTAGYDPDRVRESLYGVGRYDERRSGMYTTALFAGGRDWHVGVDLAGPVGEPVYAFSDGAIHAMAYNAAPGDYGYTIVTVHLLEGRAIWALHGHLSARSFEGRSAGQAVRQGEVLGWLGDRHENGGWNPHVHFQLSIEAPPGADLPGVVTEADRPAALVRFPDPWWVLGPLW